MPLHLAHRRVVGQDDQLLAGRGSAQGQLQGSRQSRFHGHPVRIEPGLRQAPAGCCRSGSGDGHAVGSGPGAGQQLEVCFPEPRKIGAVGGKIVDRDKQMAPLILKLFEQCIKDLIGAGRVLDQGDQQLPGGEAAALHSTGG